MANVVISGTRDVGVGLCEGLGDGEGEVVGEGLEDGEGKRLSIMRKTYLSVS
jgi:hypothetical protein